MIWASMKGTHKVIESVSLPLCLSKKIIDNSKTTKKNIRGQNLIEYCKELHSANAHTAKFIDYNKTYCQYYYLFCD